MPEWNDLVKIFSPEAPVNKAVPYPDAPLVPRRAPIVTPNPAVTDEATASTDVPAPVTDEAATAAPAPVADEAASAIDAPAPAIDDESPATTPALGHDQEPEDRFDDLGSHVAGILRSAHLACEEMRRETRAELEVRIAAVDAELLQRQIAIDEREQELDRRILVADEEAAAKAALATADAERALAELRTDAETRLAALLEMQDSLRGQLDTASNALRQTLATMTDDAEHAPSAS